MIQKLYTIESGSLDPYLNLGLEEYLMYQAGRTECILYLWQNERTVVIGRNQNAWKECRAEKLEEDGGHLARRLSGGGAVFHDLGNLNFTFLARKENYDVEKQTEVILRAVNKLGIRAEKSGRNDITVKGCKISGNAYYRTGDYCYHHGTILLHTDQELMERYLRVSRKKLDSKGVDSVRSRVGNLCAWVPDLNRERMTETLKEALGLCYGCPVEDFPGKRLEGEDIQRRAERFASWEWKYGRQIPFSDEVEERFPWGEIRIQLNVDEGRIQEARLFTDSMDAELTGRLEKYLAGLLFRKKEIRNAMDGFQTENEIQTLMKKDITNLMELFF